MTRRTLTVATYNIHRGIGSDGRFDRTRTIAAVRSLEADIVALQEVDSRPSTVPEDLFAAISETCGRHAFAAPTLSVAEGSYGNLLLSRWPIRRAVIVDLSVPFREPRNAIDAIVDVAGSGAVRFVAAHFGLDRRQRRHQVETMAARLETLMDIPTVVLGDFNEWRRSGPVSRLLSQHLTATVTGASFPARFPVWPLDRIWRRRLQHETKARVVRTRVARIASDHLPVVAEFR